MSGEAADASAGTQALQSALSAEHAAIYAYGVIGGVLGGTSTAVMAAYTAHRGRRDQLIAMLGDAAVAAEALYELPFDVSAARKAARLAVHVEQRCAGVYAAAVAQTTGRRRAFVARALTDCAVRGLGWGAEPEPFPGVRGR